MKNKSEPNFEEIFERFIEDKHPKSEEILIWLIEWTRALLEENDKRSKNKSPRPKTCDPARARKIRRSYEGLN